MNNVIFLGRITKDPEIKQTSGGKSYCRFTLAVDKDKDSADFIPCVCWEDNADNLCKYVQKGRKLLVSGKMQSGSYQDNSGIKHYTLDAYLFHIEFLDRPKDPADRASGFKPSNDDPPLFD